MFGLDNNCRIPPPFPLPPPQKKKKKGEEEEEAEDKKKERRFQFVLTSIHSSTPGTLVPVKFYTGRVCVCVCVRVCVFGNPYSSVGCGRLFCFSVETTTAL